MTFDDSFFAKAEEVAKVHEKANAHGRKLGTWQDRGVFFGADAPANLRNQLMPVENLADWVARTEAEEADSLNAKLGKGYTITYIYHDPSLRLILTPEEIERLWQRYFFMYPHEDTTPWPYPDFVSEAAKRRAARKLTA